MNDKGLKLAYVGHGDFRCSATTLYNAAAAGYRRMYKNETFLLVSKSGYKLIWVLGLLPNGGIDYRGWDLPKSRPWHPYMIAEYARECGLKINVKDFEAHLTKKLEAA